VSLHSEELEIVRVLVVDDHTLFAQGTVALLSYEPRILVIGIAKNGIECMDFFSKNKPDVVLLDIRLPDTSGIDLIDKIKMVQPEVKIIMLTGHNPRGYVTKSISKGANGFLLKDCTVKEMIRGILSVYDDCVYLSQGLEAFLQPSINSNNLHSPFSSGKAPIELLTTREIEIMKLVSKGFHNKEIASSLDIKVRTVEFHISNILTKLGVSKRFEAVLMWAHVDKETLEP